MYYYRWWTLRKHIKETPVGYGMTEFLVNRSYADKYNLIACAIGHHIYETAGCVIRILESDYPYLVSG